MSSHRETLDKRSLIVTSMCSIHTVVWDHTSRGTMAWVTSLVAGSDVPLHSSTRLRNFRLHETEHGNCIARNGVSRCGVPTAQPQDLLGPAALLESTVIRDTDGPRRVSGRVECDGSASGRALDVSHVRHDSCNVAHGSIGVTEAVQRADVRPAPERLESGLKTGLFPLD